MELLPLVCFITPILFIGFPMCYMAYRNKIVYEYRIHWLDEDCGLPFAERHRRYRSLPSYSEMMWQLFTFNWDHCWDETEKS